MNDTQPKNEFRLKSGVKVSDYLKRFSSTEKVIFSIFFVLVVVTAVIMASEVNGMFLTEIPARGGNLNEGVVGLPRSINPVLAISDTDKDISSLVYSGLMKYKDGKIVPDLALSYKISDDGLIYSFTLNPNAKFQDGEPLTAEDIVFTIQKIQDPNLKSPRRGDWADVVVKTNSAKSVQFILKKAYAPFLTNTTVGILPKHVWKDVSNDQFIFSQYNTEPIGSGPYEIVSTARNNGGIPTRYKLSTWRGFYGEMPKITNINFSFYSDEDKAYEALDAGDIDSLSSISADKAANIASDLAENYKVLSAPLPRIFGVFFNQNQAPVLADPAVRLALDVSINRDLIVKTVLHGYGSPIHVPIPQNIFNDAHDNNTDKANLVLATSTLEKNGWKKNSDGIYQKADKKGVTLLSFDIYTADTPDLKQAAEMVKADWAKLGADVSLKVFESSDLYQNVIRTRKYDALLFGEFIGKDRDLFAFWHSSEKNSPGLNVSMYGNASADKLLESMRTTSNEDSLKKYYKDFNALVDKDNPAAFLYSPNFIYVVPKNLGGVELENITVPSDRWNSMTSWYLNTENVWKVFSKDNEKTTN